MSLELGTPPRRPLAGDELLEREVALAQRRWVPGEAGIWALIFTDLTVFTVYFIEIMVSSRKHPQIFAAGRAELSLTSGILNTFFLLTASMFVALGVQALRRGRVPLAQKLYLGAACCGALFVGNKAVEWSHVASHGHRPTTNIFFQQYYIITGIHLCHVLIAMTLLFFVRRRASRVVDSPTPRQARFIENCACYWHMVDLLWLGILALFYLVH